VIAALNIFAASCNRCKAYCCPISKLRKQATLTAACLPCGVGAGLTLAGYSAYELISDNFAGAKAIGSAFSAAANGNASPSQAFTVGSTIGGVLGGRFGGRAAQATLGDTVGSGAETIYRVFGGDARAQGFSWTTKDLRATSNFRDLAGLPSGGASGATNTAEFMIKGSVNFVDIIKLRSALPLDGNKGGLPELIIVPKNVRITDFSVLKP
jgi:hypothetical protein